jgi:hypothetical protein
MALAIWLYPVFAHGGFWRAGERERGALAPPVWPEVVAVIRARDKASARATRPPRARRGLRRGRVTRPIATFLKLTFEAGRNIEQKESCEEKSRAT